MSVRHAEQVVGGNSSPSARGTPPRQWSSHQPKARRREKDPCGRSLRDIPVHPVAPTSVPAMAIGASGTHRHTRGRRSNRTCGEARWELSHVDHKEDDRHGGDERAVAEPLREGVKRRGQPAEVHQCGDCAGGESGREATPIARQAIEAASRETRSPSADWPASASLTIFLITMQ